jgi:hypothetical protein
MSEPSAVTFQSVSKVLSFVVIFGAMAGVSCAHSAAEYALVAGFGVAALALGLLAERWQARPRAGRFDPLVFVWWGLGWSTAMQFLDSLFGNCGEDLSLAESLVGRALFFGLLMQAIWWVFRLPPPLPHAEGAIETADFPKRADPS